MIMLEHDLAVLERGVREGRRTFSNIIKYLLMGTSSNFGNMLSMAGAAVFLPFLPMLPVQILLNNLLYDFSEAAIPIDRVDEDMIERPRRWDVKFIRDAMLTFGSVSSVFDVLTFWLLLGVFGASEHLFQTGWFKTAFARDPATIGKTARSHIVPPNAFAAATQDLRLFDLNQWYGITLQSKLGSKLSLCSDLRMSCLANRILTSLRSARQLAEWKP